MNLFILYGTKEGQTRKICEVLRGEAGRHGHSVILSDASTAPSWNANYDGVIIAASLHAGKYLPAIKKFIQTHADALNKVHSAFISVSLTAAGHDADSRKELDQITRAFLDNTGWKPDHVEQVAGALQYSKYNFFMKRIMRFISKRSGGDTDLSHDYEYTNWDQVKKVVTKMEG